MKQKKEDLLQLEEILDSLLMPVGFMFVRNKFVRLHDDVTAIVTIRRHRIVGGFFVDLAFYLNFLEGGKKYDFKTEHLMSGLGCFDIYFGRPVILESTNVVDKLKEIISLTFIPFIVRIGSKEYFLKYYPEPEVIEKCWSTSSAYRIALVDYVNANKYNLLLK
jgi:hypothetical protein